MIITTGVALFMGGGSSASKRDADVGGGGLGTALIGGFLLTFSLCFDGATGAYEDKLMAVNNVEPFDLMFNIQLGKSFISFLALVITNNLATFFSTLSEGGIMLVVLGLTGALGQVFVFVTISKFGALNCALIGLVRKILSLVLSFVLYGHTMNAFQTLGLVLAITSMIANFYEKGPKRSGAAAAAADEDKTTLIGAMQSEERNSLLDGAAYDDDDEEGGQGQRPPRGSTRSPTGASSKAAAQQMSRVPSHGGIEMLQAKPKAPLVGDVDLLTPTESPHPSHMHMHTPVGVGVGVGGRTTSPFSASAAGMPSSASSFGSADDGFDVQVTVDRVTPSKDYSHSLSHSHSPFDTDDGDISDIISVSIDRVTPVKPSI
jgi:UDP-galactose transporter B1